MIRREDVVDLRPGDVVELRCAKWWPEGTVLRGPVHEEHGTLYVGDRRLNNFGFAVEQEVTVVSRAPRPLYVNHDRAEPVPGDVVRDADSDNPRTWTWHEQSLVWWETADGTGWDDRVLPKRLRLLVDGETGQVVP